MAQITLGSTTDSTLDSRPSIQAALDAVEERGGGVARLTGGNYYIGDGAEGHQGIQIGNDTHLLLDQDAVIIRNFTSGGDAGATIRNKVQSGGGNTNIRISGGTIRNDLNFSGHHLGFIKTDYLTISDVRFLGSRHWNISLRNCNDVIVSNLSMDSGEEVHSSGVQIAGGARYVIADCDITCGDDAIALVVDVFGSESIRDIVISNCYLHSRQAHALRLRVEPATGATINRVSVSNIVAKAGVDGSTSAGGISIVDDTDFLRITDIAINGFWLDASESYLEALVVEFARRVQLDRVTILSPRQRARIDGCIDIELLDCTIDTPRLAGNQCLLVAATHECINVRIRGGLYRGAKQHGIQIGTDEYQVPNVQVANVTIEEAANNGLLLWNVTLATVTGNTIYGCGGWGIQELGTITALNTYIGNQLRSNTAGPILLLPNAFGTEAIRNVANPGVLIQDTGGFRQTIDGWTLPTPITNGTSLGLTEMDRANGRFRAASPGSVTGIVVTVSEPRTGGSMTVRAYKNTGNAGTPSPHTDTGLSVVINTTGHNRAALRFPMNNAAVSQFLPGDELYLMIETTSWTVATGPTEVFCALEIED